MYETSPELRALQELIDRSLSGGSTHLRGIISGDRIMSAADVAEALDGMKVLTLATTTANGEPRVSAVDGHFIHGAWTFGTSGSAIKARHLEKRPAVSAAHIDGERLGVFCHGMAVRLAPDDPLWRETIDHWTRHYGSDPTTWGDDIRMFRIAAHWLVGYRGITP